MLEILKQADLFEAENKLPKRNAKKTSRSGAFTDNMKLPVHRWFRYSAGFSGEWAEEIIAGKSFSRGQV